MELPSGARIFIIDGVAGAGKSTLRAQLKKNLGAKVVYDFAEEELLFGWKHVWIPGITEIRLEFLSRFLDYCEEKLREDPDAVFILERFHLSLAVLAWALNQELPPGYDTLIHRLKKLPVHLFIPVLDAQEIEQRASHAERSEIWKKHLQRRLQMRKCANLEEMYTTEQEMVLRLAAEQDIPYTTVRIDAKE